MKIFVIRLTFIVLLVCATSSVCCSSDHKNCQNSLSAYDQKMCYSQELERLDKEINRIWEKALAATPKDGSTNDTRKEQQQLIKSQRAWSKFLEEDCAAVGGREGGNNQWVTIFAQTCEIEMFENRIKLLKKISGEK